MNILNLGRNIEIHYNPDWEGDATVKWTDTDGAKTTTLPGNIALLMLTGIFAGVDDPIDVRNLIGEVVQARRDFELLRRQAEVFKREMEKQVIWLNERLKVLEGQ